MPKLVVMAEGKVLSEWSLNDQDVLIGRGADCHILVQDPSVSRHHAKIARIYTGYFVEDLGSTNGVTLNGRRIQKYMLKDGDRVQIGTHELRFIAEESAEESKSDKTVVLSVRDSQRQRNAPPPPSERAGRAYLRFLTGPQMGDSKLVDKSIYTIGEPGGDLAVISRRGQGYVLLHLGGAHMTTLNGEPVHGAAARLNDGDQIQVGDTKLEFYTGS
jgi:pSer/pThr/pTyr-binding forkhead associated (FHA) protein